MRLRIRRLAGNQEGASLVEFSLVAFMFIISMLGVVELGRMILVYNSLADASRAGMRYAIVHGVDNTSTGLATTGCAPSSCTGINQVVRDYASTGLLTWSGVTVTVSFPDSSTKPGSRVSVTAAYTYDPIVGWFSSKLNKNMGSTSQGVIVY